MNTSTTPMVQTNRRTRAELDKENQMFFEEMEREYKRKTKKSICIIARDIVRDGEFLLVRLDDAAAMILRHTADDIRLRARFAKLQDIPSEDPDWVYLVDVL